jgi:hypothetical protein
MPIRWEQIEPTVERKLRQYIESALDRPEGVPVFIGGQDDRERVIRLRLILEQQHLGLIGTGLVALLAPVALAIGIGVVAFGSSLLVGILLACLGVGATTWVFWWGSRQTRVRWCQPDVLRLVLPILAESTRMERLYGDVLLLLKEQESLLGAKRTHDLLEQLNLLLQNGRLIEEQQREILRVQNSQSRGEMKRERDRLVARLDRAKDDEARETWRQTLLLVDARHRLARDLEPFRERLEAQEKMICETLASMESAIAGLTLAPVAAVSVTLESVQETVLRLHQQTAAVGQAVQEVMGMGV